MQESSYILVKIGTTCGLGPNNVEVCVKTDFGISQIHYKNLDRFSLDKRKLITDLSYSIDAGAKVLGTYNRYQSNEPSTWFCRYNVGNRNTPTIKRICLDYKNKVDKYL